MSVIKGEENKSMRWEEKENFSLSSLSLPSHDTPSRNKHECKQPRSRPAKRAANVSYNGGDKNIRGGAPGGLSQLSICLLISAQVLTSGL